MNTPDNKTLLADPLSDVARKQRKFLLLVSSIGALVGVTGLIPSRISALGIEFEQANQRSILYCLSALIIYFLLAFVIYGYADYLALKSRINDAKKRRVLDERNGVADADPRDDLDIDDVRPDLIDQDDLLRRKSLQLSKTRAFFEFAFPIVWGLLVAIMLLFLHIPEP